MKVSKKMIVPAMAFTILGASVVGMSSVNAQSKSDSLAEKIASKFNLSQDEVQAVVDESKQEHMADRQAKKTERLQEKVNDGTLTAEQKTLLEARFTQMQEERMQFRDQDLTREERQTQMKQKRDELKSWAEENNIPIDELQSGGGMGHGKHNRFGGGQ